MWLCVLTFAALMVTGCSTIVVREGHCSTGMLVADADGGMFSNITFSSKSTTDKVEAARVSFTITRTGTPDPFGKTCAHVYLTVLDGTTRRIIWDTAAFPGVNSFIVTGPMQDEPFYGTQFQIGLFEDHPVNGYPMRFDLTDFKLEVSVRTTTP